MVSIDPQSIGFPQLIQLFSIRWLFRWTGEKEENLQKKTKWQYDCAFFAILAVFFACFLTFVFEIGTGTRIDLQEM